MVNISEPWLARAARIAGSATACALLAAVVSIGSGCIVDFKTNEENAFSCTQNSDCLPPNECIDEVCKRPSIEPEPECEDEDGDGYGEGEVCLGPDCDDTDPNSFPGAPELCDGKDNDCDCLENDTCDNPGLAILDEVTECTEDDDCPDDPAADNGMRCVMGVCQYRCPLDTVGVCGTAGPDGAGAVRACETIIDENTMQPRALLPACAAIGAYGPDYSQVGENEEACDGLDNNCNRRVDGNENCEICDPDVVRECSTDLGICSVGVFKCDENLEPDCVDPDTMDPVTEPGDVVEACNGLDDDCDNIVDDAPNDPRASTICPDGCPFGMVLVSDGQRSWCIDRFEASRPDATPDSPGVDNTRSVSRPGVVPWTNLSLTEARDACRGPAGITFAQKRLCSLTELQFTCGGNNDLFPYGPNFTANICNGADAGLGQLAPTGPTDTVGDQDFAGCISTRGNATIYDLSGNAAEFALDQNLGKIFGGSFLSDGNSMTCRFSIDGQNAAADVGFRCCYDP